MRLVLILLSLFITQSIYAQNYKTGIGVKYEVDFAVSVKHFFDDENCVELSFGKRYVTTWDWTKISAAYLRHCHLPKAWGNNLRWYYGAGPSIYLATYEANNSYDYSRKRNFLGVNGYLGTEFTFPNFPIAISSTWTPTWFINGYTDDLRFDYGSFAIRYTFK